MWAMSSVSEQLVSAAEAGKIDEVKSLLVGGYFTSAADVNHLNMVSATPIARTSMLNLPWVVVFASSTDELP